MRYLIAIVGALACSSLSCERGRTASGKAVAEQGTPITAATLCRRVVTERPCSTVYEGIGLCDASDPSCRWELISELDALASLTALKKLVLCIDHKVDLGAVKLPPSVERIGISITSWHKPGDPPVNFDWVAKLPALNSLEITMPSGHAAGPIGENPALERLVIHGRIDGDLGFLAKLPALEELEIDPPSARPDTPPRTVDLQPLAALRNLTTLTLRVAAHDIGALAGLTRLAELDLVDAPISDLGPLQGLTNLESLKLDGAKAADLSPLTGLRKLQTLKLRNAPAADAAPLASLTNLEVLDLTGLPIRDLGPLARLSQLTELYLGDTRARDLTPLQSLAKLKILDLAKTDVRSLKPLAGALNLEQLAVPGNRVGSLAPIARLPKLFALHLGYARKGVVSVAPLRSRSELEIVRCWIEAEDEQELLHRERTSGCSGPPHFPNLDAEAAAACRRSQWR